MAFSADTLKLTVDAHSQQFNITLPSNLTTGFSWTAKQYDKNSLKLIDKHYQAPQTKLIGAGGKMQFTFSRVKGMAYPKSTTILFRYARSWEHGGGVIKKVVVTFK